MNKAFAYLRTSSAANVGKDSDKRQRAAVVDYAKRSRLKIVQEFYDAAVSGADAIQDRPEFSKLLDALEANGVRVVLVEDASRFARDLIAQETGLVALIERGVKVFASNGDELTTTDDPMRKAMRQIAGAFAELEKSRLVAKLKAARDRKRAGGVKVEGRKSIVERVGDEQEQAKFRKLLKRLNQPSRKTGKRPSLRGLGTFLADAGHTTSTGKPLSPSMVKRLLEGG